MTLGWGRAQFCIQLVYETTISFTLKSKILNAVIAYFASEKVCFKAKIYIFQTFTFIKFLSLDATMLKIKIFVLPLQMKKQNSKVGYLKQN